MNFKDSVEDDLNEVFFNQDEFGKEFILGEKSIILIETDDYDIASTKHRAFLAKSSDLVGLNDGDTLVSASQSFSVVNFDTLEGESDISLIMLEIL